LRQSPPERRAERENTDARKAALQSRLNAPEMPELLHPRMADVYREKVRSLTHALESEDSRASARTKWISSR